MVTELNDRFAREAKEAVEAVRAYALERGVPCTPHNAIAIYAELERSFAALGRTHDFSILDACQSSGGSFDGYFQAALFKSGRPVMVIPEGVDRFGAGTAIVAWDGSAEAARAINEALPLLQAMALVEVVCVSDENQAEEHHLGVAIKRHLSRHEVEATLVYLSQNDDHAADVLIAHVRTTKRTLS